MTDAAKIARKYPFPCAHCRNPTPHTVCCCYYPPSAPNSKGSQMSDELNVWRDACFAYGGASIVGAELEPKAAAVIRDYGDRRDADAYQRGKLEGARLALDAAATVAPSKTPSGECETVGQWTRRTLREAIRALDPAKIVGEG